mmetsp:Transcript_15642/g.33058  ORF Transcript_15642/g.33058 Transcript_15642/m.33058 type:complete len:203 (+) Transcript_15642:60-668(+)
MKQALLLYAKRRFNEMKSDHERQTTTGSTTTTPKSSPSQLAAPISPTPNLIIEVFLPLLGLSDDSFLVDLGCGDGRWLIAANKQFGCRCLGIDVDEERLERARKSICENGLGEEAVQVRRQDVFEFAKECDEIREADVVVLYLFREAMVEMGALLRRRVSLGERRRVQILSVGFALVGWNSVREEKINGIRVYLYSTDGQHR